MTATAIDAQDAVVDALKGTFTLRGRWFEKGNYFGIKIKPAKKNDLSAEVKTRADWLRLHETGGVKRPQGSKIAIPARDLETGAELVRRLKSGKIGEAQRPKNLKRSFFATTKSGQKLLIQRFARKIGKYKGKPVKTVVKYLLDPDAPITKRSTFFKPGKRAIKRHLERNVRRGIADALRTMR